VARFEYDVGIIGGGAAGLSVAAGAARLGVKTLLVEKEKNLGGDCLHYGCVPSKTLISSAAARQAMLDAERFGLAAVEVPPVDFARIRERIETVIKKIQEHDSVERFRSLGADVIFGPARFSDEHTVEVDAKRFTAAKWVIATGSSAAAPAIPGLDQVPFLTNRGIFSLDRLPESLVVLGGGPIAIEMAQAFNRLGCRVEVVQRSGQILSKEDPDMAALVMEKMAAEGVRFHLDTRVTGAGRTEKGVFIRYEDREGETRTVEGETMLVALGRSPNTGGLGLEGIGVESDRRGIKVDARLRTTRPHIYAAGDVNGAYQFTHAAGYEAGIVVANAVFHLPRRARYDLVPWCTYTSPELASIGMNEKMAQKAGIEYRAVVEEFNGNDRHLAGGGGPGRIKLILGRRNRPIGVQIASPHAGELLAEWVCAMNASVPLATMAAAVHPYPTLAEMNRKPCATVMSEKLFSPWVRKTLALLFRYRGRTGAN